MAVKPSHPDLFPGARDLATGRDSLAISCSIRHLGDPLLLHPAGPPSSGTGQVAGWFRATPPARASSTCRSQPIVFKWLFAPLSRRPHGATAGSPLCPLRDRAGLGRVLASPLPPIVHPGHSRRTAGCVRKAGQPMLESA